MHLISIYLVRENNKIIQKDNRSLVPDPCTVDKGKPVPNKKSHGSLKTKSNELWCNNSQFNKKVFSHYMRSVTWIKCHHNVLLQIMSMEKPLTSKFFLMVQPIIFFSLTLPHRTTFYPLKWGFYGSSAQMPKPPQVRFYHFFYNRCYLNFLSNAFVLILSKSQVRTDAPLAKLTFHILHLTFT